MCIRDSFRIVSKVKEIGLIFNKRLKLSEFRKKVLMIIIFSSESGNSMDLISETIFMTRLESWEATSKMHRPMILKESLIMKSIPKNWRSLKLNSIKSYSLKFQTSKSKISKVEWRKENHRKNQKLPSHTQTILMTWIFSKSSHSNRFWWMTNPLKT